MEDQNGGHRRASSADRSDPDDAANQGDPGAPASAADTGTLETRFRAGEIIGWRAWRVQHGHLWSVFCSHVIWPRGSHIEAPALSAYDYGGIHAFKTRAAAEEYVQWFRDAGRYSYSFGRAVFTARESGIFVIGAVALWGTVIEHVRGYRAQFARPVMLVSGDCDWIEIAKNYGI